MSLRALRKTEEVVRLVAVCLRLQVFMAIVGGYNYPNGSPVNADEELPLVGFYSGNGLGFGHFPWLAIVDSTNVVDAFVEVLSI